MVFECKRHSGGGPHALYTAYTYAKPESSSRAGDGDARTRSYLQLHVIVVGLVLRRAGQSGDGFGLSCSRSTRNRVERVSISQRGNLAADRSLTVGGALAFDGQLGVADDLLLGLHLAHLRLLDGEPAVVVGAVQDAHRQERVAAELRRRTARRSIVFVSCGSLRYA